jgi:hypothetical protein
MKYFDYESVARDAGISSDDLNLLCQHVRSEFPSDEMMYELHVLRACMAIRDHFIRLEDALHPAVQDKPL